MQSTAVSFRLMPCSIPEDRKEGQQKERRYFSATATFERGHHAANGFVCSWCAQGREQKKKRKEKEEQKNGNDITSMYMFLQR